MEPPMNICNLGFIWFLAKKEPSIIKGIEIVEMTGKSI
jgi:hypothetical protein